jgi:hypothetical protein
MLKKEPESGPESLQTSLQTLQDQLHHTPFSDIEAAWKRVIPDPRDLLQVRRVCFIDRYFLLTKVLHRLDLLEYEWFYNRCREVEADPDGYLDVWSRGHGKSSIITIGGAIQEVLRNPEVTIGIFSHTGAIAKAFLATIKREFEHNTDLRLLFPDVLYDRPAEQSPSWSLDAGIIVKRRGNPKEATIEASGLVDGQPISKHFALMIFDDVVTEKSVATEDQIAKTNEAWSLADNLGARNARKWTCGTRYHYADTYSLMAEKGAVKVRKWPATKDGTLTGEPWLLTPEEWAAKKRDQLESTVACQLLCDPQAGNQRMFDCADIVYYEVRPETLSAYLLVDPAHSLKKESDDTAMVVIGIDAAGNKYLLDGIAHHIDLAGKWKWLRDLRAKWSIARGVQSVKVGYERYGAQSDLQYFEEKMRTEGGAFEIEELAWPRSGLGSKRDRVQRLSPDFKQHRFYIPYPTKSDRLTSLQIRANRNGTSDLIAWRIVRRNEDNKVYDLSQRFMMQVNDFPFCQKKDIIDAVSRIYDMEIRTPILYQDSELEPAQI